MRFFVKPEPLYGGTDPLTHCVCFILFLRGVLMLWPTDLVLFFSGCFVFSQACWRQANVTQIPKGPPSSSVANYRPIYITSVLSKMFDRLVSVRLVRFMERSGVLPTIPIAYRNGLSIHCKVHWRVDRRLENVKVRVFYGPEPPSGESTTTESIINCLQ